MSTPQPTTRQPPLTKIPRETTPAPIILTHPSAARRSSRLFQGNNIPISETRVVEGCRTPNQLAHAGSSSDARWATYTPSFFPRPCSQYTRWRVGLRRTGVPKCQSRVSILRLTPTLSSPSVWRPLTNSALTSKISSMPTRPYRPSWPIRSHPVNSDRGGGWSGPQALGTD